MTEAPPDGTAPAHGMRGLRALARMYGVQSWYVDAGGRRQYADRETLLATLRALDAHVATERDVGDALRHRHAQLRSAGLEPVHVAWNGRLRDVELRDPAAGTRPLQLELRLETGEVRGWRATPVPVAAAAAGTGATPVCFRVPLDCDVPLGYHRLGIEAPARTYETLIIAAPRRAHEPTERSWGSFAPLYAISSARGGAIGDFTDLAALIDWTAGLGGAYVSTLPLLATFLDAPFEPSPYAPVSRLFWNEIFLDVEAVPCGGAVTAETQAEWRACRAGELIDYRRIAASKRRILGDSARRFFADGNADTADFTRFLGENERARDYARFRAVGDRLRTPWPEWPDRLRAGELRTGDFDAADERYHLFVQYAADRQLAAVTARAQSGGAQLYLDMPLGVNAAGYDVWREPDLFAHGASAGAPPDALFSGGQDWGFPPLNPDAVRRAGYGYVIASLRHHLRYARLLRLDHVMALRRLYWVPTGLPATRGAYVRYPQDEWLALLALESLRHGATIIGEDLGTVPREVRTAMDRHGLQRMFVVQFEIDAGADPPLAAPPRPVIASLNTHDMPPFAAYWQGLDIDDQLALGLVDAAGAASKRAGRARLRRGIARMLGLPDDAAAADRPRPALHALLEYLAASDARRVLVNLEDLWLETRPHNVPGTSTERPNWRRRLRHSFEELTADRDVRALLTSVARHRMNPGA